METGMTNLGAGGEAKASPADRADTNPAEATGEITGNGGGRGGTMDAAMGANADPALSLGTVSPQVGQGQTAAYGETVENAPFPTAAGGEDNDQEDDLDDDDDEDEEA